MKDMNAGVEAFRAKLQALGAKNIGLYIGTYFMEEHSISTDKFSTAILTHLFCPHFVGKSSTEHHSLVKIITLLRFIS